MTTASSVRGLIVPMISPLTHERRIDTQAVTHVIRHLLSVQIDGLFVLGTTGEARRLDDRQKRVLVERVVPTAKGRCAIYVGISDNQPHRAIQAARLYHRLGAEFAVAHPPVHKSLSSIGLADFFRALADSIPMPLVLYNMPRITGVSIPLDTLEGLAAHPNIYGLKDSENDAERLRRVLDRLAGRDDFNVLVGCAALSSDGLRHGAAGLVPSTANLFPLPYLQMIRAAQQGEWNEVSRLQAMTDQLSAQYQHGRQLDESLAALKQLMAGRGLCGPTAFVSVAPAEPMGEPA